MKEHPIIFSSAMVKAILDGRKSVTRRVLKPQPVSVEEDMSFRIRTHAHCDPATHSLHGDCGERRWALWFELEESACVALHAARIGWSRARVRTERKHRYCTLKNKHERSELEDYLCPYGRVGDRLWVREAWAYVPRTAYGGMVPFRDDTSEGGYGGMCAVYRAGWERSQPGRWRPSIHMPRWASRLTLEVCEVRVERVNAISEVDARAEGAEPLPCVYLGRCNSSRCPRHGPDPHRVAFRALWDGLNAARGYPFDAGCWVWVIAFRVLADPARASG